MIDAMIVPILTKPDLLYRMIDSIDHDIEHLIIIDNGQCVDRELLDTRWRHHIKRMSLISMPANLGVAGSWNLGIKATPFARSWLICNFDIKWPKSSLRMFDDLQRSDMLVLSNGSPEWCAFMLGEDVVKTVGLFDEALHPAYFEDNDYERRTRQMQFTVMRTTIPVHHDNSSTLNAGYREKNDFTFAQNRTYYERKVFRCDDSAGEWSLRRRRELTWD
jgi:GT2 family glycosyltransferase